LGREAIVGPPDRWTDVLTHLALDSARSRRTSAWLLEGKPTDDRWRCRGAAGIVGCR
jgi:hypothetical protein